MLLASAKPIALAAMVTICVPSASVFSGAVSAKFTDVDPAGTVTVAGTVRCAVSSEASATVRSEALVTGMDTVPVPVLPSVTGAGRLNERPSTTLIVAAPSVQFATCAVIVTGRVPLSI